MDTEKRDKNKKLSLETLGSRQDSIIAMLHEEQQRAKEKFPLTYGLLATFGLVCIFAGLNRIIKDIDFLNNNPIALIAVGLAILIITGAAYKKLG